MKSKKVKRKMFFIMIIYIALGAILVQSVGSTVYQIIVKTKEKKAFETELAELKDKGFACFFPCLFVIIFLKKQALTKMPAFDLSL